MGMDGLTLTASVNELKALIGGRIDKINQPERDELVLSVRAGSTNYKLLLSIAADNCRVQLTNATYKNPPAPPMFCMLLRKRIGSARIIDIEQIKLDRVVHITLEGRDDLGDTVVCKLIAEIMGKHSNVILIDDKGRVVDSMRHVTPSMSSVRLVMPGNTYTSPPAQEKSDPRVACAHDFFNVLSGNSAPHASLSAAFSGLSPTMAKAVLSSKEGEAASLDTLDDSQKNEMSDYLVDFYKRLLNGQLTPSVVFDALGNAKACYPFVPHADGEVRNFSSMGAALDEYYASRAKNENLKRHASQVLKILQNNLDRCEKKAALYEKTLCDEPEMERLRRFGELLTANLHEIKRGMAEVTVLDYYAFPSESVTIELNQAFTPADNAQRYFKKYQKLRIAFSMAAKQLDDTLKEKLYIEGQLNNLDKCTTTIEILELHDELVREGYIKKDTSKKAQKLPPSKPMHFISSDGIDIFVGKNNVQNDMLTLKLASPFDMWLHTKDIPGSHVIVKCASDMPDATLLEAALLAAYYSRAKGGCNVPVDYARKKYVKKPSGARPGMVIYTSNKTMFVTPDEAAIAKIKVIDK